MRGEGGWEGGSDKSLRVHVCVLCRKERGEQFSSSSTVLTFREVGCMGTVTSERHAL